MKEGMQSEGKGGRQTECRLVEAERLNKPPQARAPSRLSCRWRKSLRNVLVALHTRRRSSVRSVSKAQLASCVEDAVQRRSQHRPVSRCSRVSMTQRNA